MGKLIYSLNAPSHGLEWANVDEELHTWFNDQSRELAASLYGRRMYELMAGAWPAIAPFFPPLEAPLNLPRAQTHRFASGVMCLGYCSI